MRQYELMVILDPETEERTVSPRSTSSSSCRHARTAGPSTTSTSGVVAGWPTRSRSSPEGIYAVVNMTAEPATAKELDRQLGLNETVLRTKLLRPDV
jgi:small subunit ribosomal protein S6